MQSTNVMMAMTHLTMTTEEPTLTVEPTTPTNIAAPLAHTFASTVSVASSIGNVCLGQAVLQTHASESQTIQSAHRLIVPDSGQTALQHCLRASE